MNQKNEDENVSQNRAIYTITTISFKFERCVGFVHSLQVARRVVTNNEGDIHEGEYQHAVIEKVYPGIYSFPRDEFWYVWRKDLETYVECPKPDKFQKVVGFSMG